MSPIDVTADVANSDKPVPREPLLSKHQIWCLVALLVVCIPGVIISANFKESVDRYVPEALPMPSTFNKRPSGYSGLFELLQKVGLKPARWQSPYRDLLKNNVKGTLVIIDPFESPSSADLATIREWVDKGNDLVYADVFTYGVGEKFLKQFDLAPISKSFKNKLIAVNENIPERAHAEQLVLSGETVLDGGNAVVGTDREAAIAVVKSGDGRCLVSTMPAICANTHIADPKYRENFQFMVNWLSHSNQPLLFDERCHGFSSSDNAMLVLLRGPLGLLALQLIIILSIAMLSLNQRFGLPLRVSRGRKISNLEFIDGLASTYRRARARDTVWAMLFSPFKARLCKTLGVSPHQSNAEIAAGYAESIGGSAQSCVGFLDASDEALARRNISEAELRSLMERCDDLAAKAPQLQPIKRVMGA